MTTTTCRASASGEGLLRRLAGALIALVLAAALAGCTVPISYFDGTTYSNLTNLKVETTALVETFDSVAVEKNADAITQQTLGLRKALEYEKGKGTSNSDTAAQIGKIAELYGKTVGEYRENGPGTLGRKYFSEAAVVLGQAFDIAISTESLKNKDKR
jgi:hypothetical protein